MSATLTVRPDRVHEVLEERQHEELRFRSAVITSTALHVGTTIALLLAPLFIPEPTLLEFTTVNLVELQPAPPEPEPAPVVEEAEPEPEPEELEPPPPEDVPEDLEAQRRREEEEEARRREEERQRREEEEARRRAAEEAERRRREEEERRRREAEEEARRQPQKAARREAPAATRQHAERGVSAVIADANVRVTEEDFAFAYWINAVRQKVAGAWEPPPRPAGSREILAVVRFRVDRSGRIIEGPDVFDASGDSRYDAAALRAILGGQPFPPLPQAYRGSTLGIRLGFRQ